MDLAYSATDSRDKERIETLEVANSSLVSKVQCLQNKHCLLEHSAEFVISGLSVSKQTDLKRAAFAVIKTIKSDFSLDDIQKCLLIRAKRKRGRSSGSKNNTLNISADIPPPPAPLTLTENMVSTILNPAILSLTPSSATVGGVSTEICSLLVTVSNSDVAREIINAEIL